MEIELAPYIIAALKGRQEEERPRLQVEAPSLFSLFEPMEKEEEDDSEELKQGTNEI